MNGDDELELPNRDELELEVPLEAHAPAWAEAPGPGFAIRSHSNLDVVWARGDDEVVYQLGPGEYHAPAGAPIPIGLAELDPPRARPGRPVMAATIGAMSGAVVGAGLVELVAHLHL